MSYFEYIRHSYIYIDNNNFNKENVYIFQHQAKKGIHFTIAVMTQFF